MRKQLKMMILGLFVCVCSSPASASDEYLAPGSQESSAPTGTLERAQMQASLTTPSFPSDLGLEWIQTSALTPPEVEVPQEPRVSSLRSMIPPELLRGQSPEKIVRFVWSSVSPVTDRSQFGLEDHWQKPQEVLESGKGDCEDFSFLTQSLFSLAGISSFVLNVYDEEQGHSMAVYKSKGLYHVVDGSLIKDQAASDVSQLAADSNPYWRKADMLRYDLLTEEFEILSHFENPQN